MQSALESLPWVRKAVVSFPDRQASLTVVSKQYDEVALLEALTGAGFGGTVAQAPEQEPAAQDAEGQRVAFHVTGMKKTRSGAT